MTEKNLAPSYGYCRCGCGQKTRLASQTDNRTGHLKGEPQHYVYNHHSKNARPARRKSSVDYIAEDRGYKTACWIWQRVVHKFGYGEVVLDGIRYKAHRVYFERFRGPLTKGLELDHLCRVRSCVNPGHLEEVTRTENVRRSAATKLDVRRVSEIKLLLRSKKYRHAEIAKCYSVSKALISAISTGRRWADVDFAYFYEGGLRVSKQLVTVTGSYSSAARDIDALRDEGRQGERGAA